MTETTINQLLQELDQLFARCKEVISSVEKEKLIIDKEKELLRDRKSQLDALDEKLKAKIAKVEKILGE
jgi:hypothetical protein